MIIEINKVCNSLFVYSGTLNIYIWVFLCMTKYPSMQTLFVLRCKSRPIKLLNYYVFLVTIKFWPTVLFCLP